MNVLVDFAKFFIELALEYLEHKWRGMILSYKSMLFGSSEPR